MTMSGMARLAAITCVLLTMTAFARAQVTTGSVSGTVKDAQGGVIPGATVTLISDTKGTKSTPAITSETGDFVFPNVIADVYTIQIEMPSFKTLQRSGVT